MKNGCICSLLLFMLFAGSAYSQPVTVACGDQDSWDSCIQKLVSEYGGKYVDYEIVSPAKENAEKTINADVEQRNSGDGDAVTGSTTSVKEDFLSKLIVSLVSIDKEGGQIPVFEVTNFLGLDTEDGYKGEIKLNRGGLYAPLAMQLNELNLAGDAQELSKRLGDFDNVSVGFSYSPNGKYFEFGQWGRNPEAYSEVTSSLIDSVSSDIEFNENEMNSSTTAIARLAVENGLDDGDDLKPLSQVIPDQKRRKQFVEALTESVEINQKNYNALVEALETNRVYEIATLIDNQPQLNISLNGTINDKLAGPDDVGFKLAYEYGMHNVNSLLKTCSIDDVGLAGCYQNFMRNNALAIQTGNRFAVSFEYQKTQSYSYTSGSDIDVSVESDSSQSIIGGLSWGRYIGKVKDGRTRVELQLAYEDVTGDPEKQSRGFATSTLSRALAEGVFASLSLVYANKPEYRGEVDQEISARLGLNYKIGNAPASD